MSRQRVVLGTAGHIDHGKTALVRALTGVDTDRLKEEKERGITIELGFAELATREGPGLGVVDVPGHEAFVRTMVAGATGMDLVLLVVAADEGVMPQTREHLAILELLEVGSLVVALTKADLVEEEWMALVDDEVAELLAGTPFASAPRVPVSAVTGAGLDALRDALQAAAVQTVQDRSHELVRLPVDRVFTVQGTGTVVTGTLWGGTLRLEDRVRLLPGDVEARIRGLQVHGTDVGEAHGGDRTAVALAGPGADREELHRGRVLVTDPAWEESWMLTVRARILPDARWPLAHNQRVRVHLGTAEVLARVALLEPAGGVAPGEEGWVQLRLEEPVCARCRDRLVLRSYSPLTTLGGGVVAEPAPRKRRRLEGGNRATLGALLDGPPPEALDALLRNAGWAGVERHRLPVLLGLAPADCDALLAGAGRGHMATGSVLFHESVVQDGARRILEAVEEEHEADGLRGEIPLARLRTAVPPWAHPRLADGLLERLAEEGRVELVGGGARRSGFEARPTADQESALERLQAVFAEAGLAAPAVEELPEELAKRPDVWSLLRHLEGQGSLTSIADGAFVDAAALSHAMARIRAELGGKEGLGPTDFREVLGVSRKHLIPLLNYFDGLGLTLRDDGTRRVPPG